MEAGGWLLRGTLARGVAGQAWFGPLMGALAGVGLAAVHWVGLAAAARSALAASGRQRSGVVLAASWVVRAGTVAAGLVACAVCLGRAAFLWSAGAFAACQVAVLAVLTLRSVRRR